jgi:hypothetical protein
VVSADYQILVTDKNMQVLGDPIVCWTTVQVTLKFNEAGSGSFTVPGYSWIRDQIIPGCRVVIVRDGSVVTSGPVEKVLWERSDDGENAGAGMLTVNFSDFLSLLAARLTYPDPTKTPSAQTIDQWTFTGQAEAALRALVDGNAGPSALPDRQIPQLVLGTLAGVGGAVTAAKADRMEPMADVMRRLAVSGGNLGFRTRQVGQQILFEVYQPVDLSGQVVFSFGNGSLKYVAYEQDAPTVNAVIVGGQSADEVTDGSDKFMIERDNAGSQDVWDRRESLVSRPGNDPAADLQADGDSALADGAETARFSFNVADTPFQKFGRDYSIGSKVSVETAPGSMLSDVVVTVSLETYPTAGEVVGVTVGSQAANSDPVWLQQIRATNKRMSYLERNVVHAV